MGENELPRGWARARLGELGEYTNGRGFRKSEWSPTGRPIIRIQNLTGSGHGFNYYDGELDERHIVAPGDLLVSWAATLGSYTWHGPEAALNQHIFKVAPFIDRAFLRHLIDHHIGELTAVTHGSGMVHITRATFENLPVAVPPLAEQRRITEALERQLSRLDHAHAQLTASAGRARRFVPRLTARLLRSSAAAPRPLRDLLRQPLVNGRSVPGAAGGFPVLRLTALRSGTLDVSERKEGRWTAAEAAPFLVTKGDFFVSRANGSPALVGRGALATTEPGPVAFPDTMIRVRVDPALIDARFLRLVWDTPPVRRHLESRAHSTTGIYKINQRILEDVPVPTPSLSEQHALLAETDRYLSLLSHGTSLVSRAEERCHGLRRSLLGRAVSGGLVPQDPAEEPAAELLARVRARRSAPAPPRRKPQQKPRPLHRTVGTTASPAGPAVTPPATSPTPHATAQRAIHRQAPHQQESHP